MRGMSYVTPAKDCIHKRRQHLAIIIFTTRAASREKQQMESAKHTYDYDLFVLGTISAFLFVYLYAARVEL
jgi:hypothetical protein